MHTALMAATSQRDLVSALLEARNPGYPLSDFIADRRQETPQRSWQAIADELAEITDGVVDVDWSTVRRWADDFEKGAA